MRRTIEISLSISEEIYVLRKWAKSNPEVLQILLKYPKGHCPFPDCCRIFPCKTLSCNADMCSNGHAYRSS